VANVFENIPSNKSAEEAKRILERMPPEIVKEAQKRAKAKKGWSGLSLPKMAEKIGIRGHRKLYALQSWAAHTRILGYNVQEQDRQGERFLLEFKAHATPDDMEALANSTRRQLHSMYATVAHDFYGEVPTLWTSGPFQTNREELRRRGLEEWDPDER